MRLLSADTEHGRASAAPQGGTPAAVDARGRDKRPEGGFGRPKSEEKRQAILDAAGRLFLRQGLQGTSMDAVAREAGVSKQTVYGHFSNKDELFRACMKAKIAAHVSADAWLPDGAEPAAGAAAETAYRRLRRVIDGFMTLMLDPEVVATHRVVAGEASSHPQVASLLFESGALAVTQAIGQCLERLVADGALRIPDIEYASWLLANMALGSFLLRLQLGLVAEVPAEELDAHLSRVADDFLRLYGCRSVAPLETSLSIDRS